MILNIIKDFFKGLLYILFFVSNTCLLTSAIFSFPGLTWKHTQIAYVVTIFILTLEYAIIKNTIYKTKL